MFARLFGKKSNAPEGINHPYFPPSVPSGAHHLFRNGVGTRERMMIKVYQAALYLPQKTRVAETALNMRGPKQIRLVALRDISASTLGSALLSGMQSNLLSTDDAEGFQGQMKYLLQILTSGATLVANDTFRLDLTDEGSIFYINDKQEGPPVLGTGFNEALLRIWLGKKPADEELKRQFLTGGV